MTNCVCENYGSFKEKLHITRELNRIGQRYSDLGGFIYWETFFYDEPTAGKLIYQYKQAN